MTALEMADIIMIKDRRERDAAIDALSDEEARKMLKSLVGVIRRMHDMSNGQGCTENVKKPSVIS